MKNFHNILASALYAALITGFVSAKECPHPADGNDQNSFRVGMYRVKNSLVMNLMIEKEKGVAVNIRLVDTSGKTLHQEYVPKVLRKVGQKFDFSDVADGNYKIEITNGEACITKHISLSTTEIAEVSGRRLIAFN